MDHSKMQLPNGALVEGPTWEKALKYASIREMMGNLSTYLSYTDLVVFHPHPNYPVNLPSHIDNMWFCKDNIFGLSIDGIENLMPTEHFEFRGDGRWAQVYWVTWDNVK